MSEQFPYSFGKYRMEAEIGRGGFGNVFRAVDVELDRPVAIKILDPMYMRDQRWVTRFRREARVMARLEHPHIVPIYEIGEQDGRLYLAMRLIDGPDLTEVIEEKGALPWSEVVEMVSQVASALDYAHEHDVIHRDMKPGNILISNGQALLTDFGLAQMMASNSQSISVSGGIAGTYNYMAPEIFQDEKATPATDVYALGCVIYEMLTGKTLFDGTTTAAIIGAHLEGVTLDEPLPEGTPQGTREVLQVALAKDPLDRYTSAMEMAQELQRVNSDRLSMPYAQLEQVLAEENWIEAVALAAQIRTQNPDYRDVAALEERAQRGQWSAQWRTEAEQALAEDNFSAVRGALMQWRRVDPENPEIKRLEENLTLKQGVPGEDQPATMPVVGTAVAITATPTVSEPFPQIPPAKQQTLPPAAPPAKRSLPGLIWWIGAAVVLIILVLGIRALFLGGTEDEPMVVTAGAGEPAKNEVPKEVVVTRIVKETVTETVVEEVEEAPLGSEEHPIQVLFVPSVDEEAIISGGELLAEELEKATGYKYEASIPISYLATIEAMCDSPDDTIGFIPAFGYVLAKERCGVQVGLASERFGWPVYWSQIVVRDDSGIESLEDLEGKTWGAPSVTSTSGFLVSSAELAAAGIETGEIIETGGHTAAMLAVAVGDVDFATSFYSPPLLPFYERNWNPATDDPEIWREAGVNPARTEAGRVFVGGDPADGGYRILDARASAMESYPTIFEETRILQISDEIPNDTLSYGAQFPLSLSQEISEAVAEYAASDACNEPPEGTITLCSDAFYNWTGAAQVLDSAFDPTRFLIDNLGMTEEDVFGE